MYTSIKAEPTKINANKAENMECLQISSFIFSFLLSFIIDLYNLIPLTARANIAGINIMLCKSNVSIEKIMPFPPKVAIIDAIV